MINIIIRADSRFASSQWETALLCNDVSHWLGANLKSSMIMNPVIPSTVADSLVFRDIFMVAQWHYVSSSWQCLSSYPGYFREVYWQSLGLPEISRVTWQVCNDRSTVAIVSREWFTHHRLTRVQARSGVDKHWVSLLAGSSSQSDYALCIILNNKRTVYCFPSGKSASFGGQVPAQVFDCHTWENKNLGFELGHGLFHLKVPT